MGCAASTTPAASPRREEATNEPPPRLPPNSKLTRLADPRIHVSPVRSAVGEDGAGRPAKVEVHEFSMKRPKTGKGS